MPIADQVAEIDFAAAEFYLSLARRAHDAGNTSMVIAARKLIMVALRVSDQPPSRTR
jgi:hypothetical protein